MKKDLNLKHDIDKISLILLKKIKKEMKVEITEVDQIKRIQTYTKLLEQLNKMFKFADHEPDVDFLDQDNRVLEEYLKFNTEKKLNL